MISAETKLNAVIGYPLTHAMSPRLHSESYVRHGINAVMLAFANPDIRTLVETIRTLHIELTAVTIPHKETIIPYLDELDDSAKSVGAVNTVIVKGNRLRGYNTDVLGVEKALDGVVLEGRSVLVVGAGGAARAVAATLSKARAQVYYWNRTEEAAQRLCGQFGGTVIDRKEVYSRVFDLIVNTTPLGMHPDTTISPLPAYPFQKQQTVMDCVYNPIETQLLKDAKQGGAITISGREMFIAQGIEQIRLWSGIIVDPKEWRELLLSTL